jgi:hypothetical protein
MPPSDLDDETNGSGGGGINSGVGVGVGGEGAAPNLAFGPEGRLVDAAAHYRDFSKDAPNPMEKEGAQNFPMKLHMILRYATQSGAAPAWVK